MKLFFFLHKKISNNNIFHLSSFYFWIFSEIENFQFPFPLNREMKRAREREMNQSWVNSSASFDLEARERKAYIEYLRKLVIFACVVRKLNFCFSWHFVWIRKRERAWGRKKRKKKCKNMKIDLTIPRATRKKKEKKKILSFSFPSGEWNCWCAHDT